MSWVGTLCNDLFVSVFFDVDACHVHMVSLYVVCFKLMKITLVRLFVFELLLGFVNVRCSLNVVVFIIVIVVPIAIAISITKQLNVKVILKLKVTLSFSKRLNTCPNDKIKLIGLFVLRISFFHKRIRPPRPQISNTVVFERVLEVLNSHPKFSFLQFSGCRFIVLQLPELVFLSIPSCPVFFVRLFHPWALKFNQSQFYFIHLSYFFVPFDDIPVSLLKSVVSDVACSSQHVVFVKVKLQVCPQFISCLEVRLKLTGWSTSQESSSFSLRSMTDLLVVNVDFCICFLEQWQPPTSIRSLVHKGKIILINREQIIDCDILWSTLHVDFDCENSLSVVL
jgi:hypothetical protein